MSSQLFHEIAGSAIILLCRGVYRQSPVYVRAGRLFARWGGGFIGLSSAANGTTIPTTRWDHIEGVEYEFDPLGRMIEKKAKDGNSAEIDARNRRQQRRENSRVREGGAG